MKLLGIISGIVSGIPTVMWHGMGDYGNSGGMNRMKQIIMDNTDQNNYVLSLVIGESKSKSNFIFFKNRIDR